MFVSLTTATLNNNSLAYIATSEGASFTSLSGIDTQKSLDFLFSLTKYKKSKIVTYAATLDFELFLKDAPNDAKDKLLSSPQTRQELNKLEYNADFLKFTITDSKASKEEKEDAKGLLEDIEKKIRSYESVKVFDYILTLKQGRSLRISKGKQSVTIYDVFGFYRVPLRQAFYNAFELDLPYLDRVEEKELQPLFELEKLGKIKEQASHELEAIKSLVEDLDLRLKKNGIELKSFSGTGSIANNIFNKHKIKKTYHYFHKYNTGKRAHEACERSFFGGRQEQLKLGTFQDVKTYDINSAYAHAITFLPLMLRKPVYTEQFDIEQPFGLGFVKYEMTDDAYLGFFPNRYTSANEITYPKSGQGWFYTPEIRYAVQNNSLFKTLEVHDGFYVPYRQNEALENAIKELYSIRQSANNKAFNKVIKLTLATLYGKFCQRIGFAAYKNMFYAGFITSFTRARLLEAIKGYEQSVICFTQDGIHTTEDLELKLDDSLGGWKRENFKEVTYLANGCYRAIREDGSIKLKSKGFQGFDFDSALINLNQNRFFFNARRIYFAGWNLTRSDLRFADKYLEKVNESITVKPYDTKTRNYNAWLIDFNKQIDSAIIQGNKELISSRYIEQDRLNEYDWMLDVIDARK